MDFEKNNNLNEIKNLIDENKLKEALQLCELPHLSEDNFIQQQRVNILIKLKRYEEAFKICDKFLNDTTMQLKRIDTLINLKEDQEVLSICSNPLFKSNELIQSRCNNVLIKLKLYEEVLINCNLPQFNDSSIIQLQHIQVLYKLHRYEEVIHICSNSAFIYNPNIQEIKIRALDKLNRHDEALRLAAKEELQQFKNIVSLKNDLLFSNRDASVHSIPKVSRTISILIKAKRIKEALKISALYENSSVIQSQRAMILFNLKRYEEALQICDMFPNNPSLQEPKIRILIELGKYEDALVIINKPEFQNSECIQYFKKKLLPEETITNEQPELPKKTIKKEKKELLDMIYTKIYNDDINISEIENSGLEEFQILVLKILYYEKNKLSAINLIKNAKTKYKDDASKTDILKKLLIRAENKHKLLDYLLYSSILKCSLIQKNEEVKETKSIEIKPLKVKPIEVKSIKVMPIEAKTIENIEKPVSFDALIKPKNEIIQKPVKEKKTSDYSKVRIQDVYNKEIQEIKMFLYVEMNKTKSKKVINLYDRFCILIEKSVVDDSALKRFMCFATYIAEISSYTDINIDKMNVKMLRYKSSE